MLHIVVHILILQESIHIPTIRNIIFGFLQFVEKNDLALDISFGTSGYSLILARAFKDVRTYRYFDLSQKNDLEDGRLYHYVQLTGFSLGFFYLGGEASDVMSALDVLFQSGVYIAMFC